MGYFAKKRGLGGYVKVEEKDSPEVYISDIEEKNAADRDIALLERTKRQNAGLRAELEEMREGSERQKRRMQAEIERLQAEKESLEEEREELRAELGITEREIEGLRRIARERANSERGITPKKDHDGFVVLSSETTTYRFKQKPDNPRSPVTERPAYRTLVQTPYSASLEMELVLSEQKNNMYYSPILTELGVEVINMRPEEAFQKDDENVLFKTSCKANFKTGYYEFTWYTTKPVTVPEHRRLPRGKNAHQ